jgi:HK97 family phage portal protein
MAIWNRKKSTHKVEKKGAVLGTSTTLGDFLILGDPGSAATPAGAFSLYEKSTAISIPINTITDSFSVLQPVLMVDGEKITEHPLLTLLKNPSPHFTQYLFFEVMSRYYLIAGETEIVAIGNIDRPPIQLEPVSPRNVSIAPKEDGTVGSFVVTDNHWPGNYIAQEANRRVRYLDGEFRELKQIRNFSTKDGSLLRGQSLLVPASREAKQHILGGDHNVALLKNGGRITLVYNMEEDLTKDDFEEAKEKIIRRFSGADNAGSMIITAGGKSTVTELGNSNRDMDFSRLQAAAKQAVALQYKVPLPLISTEASTFNNYTQAKLALYDDAVLPLADKLFGGLEAFLFPRFDLDPSKTKLTYDRDEITALTMRRNEELVKRAVLGVETIDETRETLGLEALPEGGDVLIKTATVPEVRLKETE